MRLARSTSGRWGFDFEDLASHLLSSLGYKIVNENFDVECTDPSHHKQSHEIDIIADFFSENFVRPLDSPEGRVLFECKIGEVKLTDVEEAENKLKCLNNCGKFGVLSGAIIMTNSRPKVKIKDNIFCWDMRKLFFYASKVFHFKRLQRKGAFTFREQRLEHFSYTTFIPSFETDKNIFVFMIFHEDEENPLNKLIIEETWATIQIKYANFWKAYSNIEARIEAHSLSGFTRDIESSVLIINGINIYVENALDYSTAPWSVLLGV